jgi:hypothetical protein
MLCEEEIKVINGLRHCEDCFHELYGLCEICQEYHHRDELQLVIYEGEETIACSDCIHEHADEIEEE